MPDLPRDPEALNSVLEAAYLERSGPDRPRLLGLEFECLRVRRDDLEAAPSVGDDGPDPIVLDLAAELAGSPSEVREHREGGVLSWVDAKGTNLSLEPGGQIEVSLPPMARPLEVGRWLDAYVQRLDRRLGGTPYRTLFLGHQPFTPPEAIQLRAKPRYAIMDRRLAAAGTLGRHMMRATAGMQVTLDFRDGAECARMLRSALLMAPFITAIYANSPLVRGRDSGYVSFREHVWWDTDPSRCGVPARLVADDACLRDYVDFALDAEAWFVERDGELRALPDGVSFRGLLEAGERLTLADFALHSSTLFPAARLRGGVEVRSADCVPPDMAAAFCAIQAGCLYDEEAREAVAALHPIRDQEGLRALHECTARDGLQAVHPTLGSIADVAARMIAIAEGGLRRLIATGAYEPETLALLEPVRCCLERRCCLARDALVLYPARA
ncbi:MAG: glutamate-cysteine ligase family protein [Planctomycetota bacterium]